MSNEHALALLARAKGDLYVLRRLRDDPDAPAWVLGFHAQQAVEKPIKTVLSGCELPYPRTRRLVMLSELLRNALCSLPPEVEAFGGLTPFGVVLRYEDVIDDQSPVGDAVWCEALVIGARFFCTARALRRRHLSLLGLALASSAGSGCRSGGVRCVFKSKPVRQSRRIVARIAACYGQNCFNQLATSSRVS